MKYHNFKFMMIEGLSRTAVSDTPEHRSSTQSFYHHKFKIVILHPSPLQPKLYTTSV